MLLSNVHTEQQHILESFTVSTDPSPPKVFFAFAQPAALYVITWHDYQASDDS
jgi:hypothetical protein